SREVSKAPGYLTKSLADGELSPVPPLTPSLVAFLHLVALVVAWYAVLVGDHHKTLLIAVLSIVTFIVTLRDLFWWLLGKAAQELINERLATLPGDWQRYLRGDDQPPTTLTSEATDALARAVVDSAAHAL